MDPSLLKWKIMKIARIILVLSLCGMMSTSNAMFMRVTQPVVKRIISRLSNPTITSKTQTIQRALELPARAAKSSPIKPTVRPFASRSEQYIKLFKARSSYKHNYTKPNWWQPAAFGVAALCSSRMQDRAYADSDDSNKIKSFLAVKERYRKDLEEEGSKLINQFLVAIGKTREEWEQIKVESREPFLRAVETEINRRLALPCGSISPKLKDTITNLLEQHGIDLQMVTLIRDDSLSSDMGIVGGPSIGKIGFIVNETQCNHTTQKELEWIILHEIQHLKHDDSFMNWVTADNKHANTILHKYRIFFEKRADVLAALTSLEHAQAASNRFYIRWIQFPVTWIATQAGLIGDGKHPDAITQSNYLYKIRQEMLACAKQAQR